MSRFCVPGANVDPLAYADSRLSVVPAVQAARRPLTSDKNYPIWTEWRVTKDAVAPAVEGEFWKLVSFSAGSSANWVMLGTTPGTAIATITGDVGGAVSPDVSDNINLVGGAGVTVTGNPGTNTLTIDAAGMGFSWVEVTGTSQMMAVGTGYITNNAAAVTCTLPTSAAVGDLVEVVGKGAGGFVIAQSASQQISILGQTSTAGVTGTVTPNEAGAAIRLVCITANNLWRATHSMGNFVVV